MKRFTRRRFLAGLILGTPALAVAHARFFEPGWLRLRRLRLAETTPECRFVHFTDLHHKGDREFLVSVVDRINALEPRFVCFTGDLIEDGKHLPEALEVLSGIKCPMFGIPGNHDYWAKISFDPIIRAFEKTGGAWLVDESRRIDAGNANIIGLSCIKTREETLPLVPGAKNILLMHYPAWVKNLGAQKLDVMLAGHSHGGQVRIPFLGPLITPFGVDEYDLGLFKTRNGPLYVNPGIGWFYVPVRFNCRPEITVIEI